jgi:hypothetical protein
MNALDAKSRMKEDNFLEYLMVEMNLGVPFRKGPCSSARVEEGRAAGFQVGRFASSHGFADRWVNRRLGHPAGERKQRLRRKAEELGLISGQNIWVWTIASFRDARRQLRTFKPE